LNFRNEFSKSPNCSKTENFRSIVFYISSSKFRFYGNICDDHHIIVGRSLDMQFNKHAVVCTLHACRNAWVGRSLSSLRGRTRSSLFLIFHLSFKSNYYDGILTANKAQIGQSL